MRETMILCHLLNKKLLCELSHNNLFLNFVQSLLASLSKTA